MCPVHKIHFFRVLAYNVSPTNVVSNDVQRLSLDSFDSTTHTKQSYGHFKRNKKKYHYNNTRRFPFNSTSSIFYIYFHDSFKHHQIDLLAVMGSKLIFYTDKIMKERQ